jgi:hypothetical protein
MLKYLAIFAVLLCFASSASNSAEKPANRNSGAQDATPDKRGTQDAPLIVETRPADGDKEATEEAQRDAEQKRTNRWNIGLTFWIAVCAFLQFGGIVAQVVVYLKQTKIMKGTLAEIHTQAGHMEQQTTILEKSVAAMEKSTGVVIDGQRPYVLFLQERWSIITRKDAFGGLVGYECRILIENGGESAAFDVLVHANIVTAKNGDLPSEFDYPDFNVLERKRPITIGPKGKLLTASLWLSRDDHVALLDGSKKVYFYGWATYRDGFFPLTPIRKTEFCFELTQVVTFEDGSTTFFTFTHYEHNDAT